MPTKVPYKVGKSSFSVLDFTGYGPVLLRPRSSLQGFVPSAATIFTIFLLIGLLCELPTGESSMTCGVVGISFVAVACFSFGILITDPGYLPPASLVANSNGEEGNSSRCTATSKEYFHPLLGDIHPKEAAYCDKCEHWTTTSSAHCNTCDMCVLDYDHHCGVFGSCIGLGNIRPFLLTEFFALICSWTTTFGIIIPSLEKAIVAERSIMNWRAGPQLLLFVAAFLISLIITGMLVWHWALQFTNPDHRAKTATGFMSAVIIAQRCWWFGRRRKSLLPEFNKRRLLADMIVVNSSSSALTNSSSS